MAVRPRPPGAVRAATPPARPLRRRVPRRRAAECVAGLKRLVGFSSPVSAAPRTPRPHHAVLKLRVTGGFLDGTELEFADGLNCIIGGRGTGKTTALEFLRFGFGLMPDPKTSPPAAPRHRRTRESELDWWPPVDRDPDQDRHELHRPARRVGSGSGHQRGWNPGACKRSIATKSSAPMYSARTRSKRLPRTRQPSSTF
jgi:hypothetical protein